MFCIIISRVSLEDALVTRLLTYNKTRMLLGLFECIISRNPLVGLKYSKLLLNKSKNLGEIEYHSTQTMPCQSVYNIV